jgi:hypothetical protein
LNSSRQPWASSPEVSVLGAAASEGAFREQAGRRRRRAPRPKDPKKIGVFVLRLAGFMAMAVFLFSEDISGRAPRQDKRDLRGAS